ncbi:MAG: RHS repeat-associated core domain-containing protein, partial [Chitinophagales bacterium]
YDYKKMGCLKIDFTKPYIKDYEPIIISLNKNLTSNKSIKNTQRTYYFGFNGKENDLEVDGQQDYGFRIYDSRLARFKSVDPLTKSYPELTPYQFANNTPIQAIDLDGLEQFNVNVAGTRTKPIIEKVSVDEKANFQNGVNVIIGNETTYKPSSFSASRGTVTVNSLRFTSLSNSNPNEVGKQVVAKIQNRVDELKKINGDLLGKPVSELKNGTGEIDVYGKKFSTEYTVDVTRTMESYNVQTNVTLSAQNINSPAFQSIEQSVCSQNYNTTIVTSNTPVSNQIGYKDASNPKGIGVMIDFDENQKYSSSTSGVPQVNKITDTQTGTSIERPK